MSKQFQNVSFAELIAYSETNPNRCHNLTPIEIQPIKHISDDSLDSIGLKGYTSYSLNPSGIISIVGLINDPQMYMISSTSVKKSIIADLATTLQQDTDKLKSTSLMRKRKKVHDLIGSSYNGAQFNNDPDIMDLFQCVAYMRGIHFVLIKSAVQESIESNNVTNTSTGYKGEILFSSDPNNWHYDTPIWVVDYRCRWVAVPSELHSTGLQKIIGTWLGYCENNGWIIEWPEIEGTKAEIIEELSRLPTWQASDSSLRKETLSKRLGRSRVIQTFYKWTTKIDSIETHD